MVPHPPLHWFLFFFIIFVVFMFYFADGGDEGDHCPRSFKCGNLGILQFPLTTTQRRDCGMLAIQGCDNYGDPKTIQLNNGRNKTTELRVTNIERPFNVFVVDKYLKGLLQSGSCEALSYNIALPRIPPLGYFHTDNVTVFRCSPPHSAGSQKHIFNCTCGKSVFYFGPQDVENSTRFFAGCERSEVPVNKLGFTGDPFTFITADIHIQVHLSDDCIQCSHGGRGQCRLDTKGKFYCVKGIVAPWILVLVLVLSLRHYKRKHGVSCSHVRLRSTDTHGGPCPNDVDPDSGRLFFGVPIFSYNELQQATNNFDSSRKLGDGGFGSVYYGKLQDGREVAVKHLFNHNYKRVQQFMNEVEILTQLRHKNLVSLYGCTSRQSSELILVYEYIPNGTLASHLHTNLAKQAPLTWPIRIKIAIETAGALAYLHASDIIHRDVKTNNILLDNNFNIKVADFGLSRLFPNDVSHISTAPQGTPGYLDPEYHCCFQLTNKSDVYSFGVVLMELISSMPAVDMRRDKDDIVLGNLAVRKIQRNEFEELVDPHLEIDKDSEVKRMVVAMGELAFQCLQRDKELRPSIDKVLQVLKWIEIGKEGGEDAEEASGDGGSILKSKVDIPPPLLPSLNWDQVGLKNMKSLSSPNNVTEKWESNSSTPNVSVES